MNAKDGSVVGEAQGDSEALQKLCVCFLAGDLIHVSILTTQFKKKQAMAQYRRVAQVSH
jgi:hypothetical protein